MLLSEVKKTFKLDAQLEANVEIPLLQLLVSTVSKSHHFSIIRTPLAKKYPSSVSAQLFLHLYHFTHGIHPHYHYYDCIVHPRLSRLVRLIFDPPPTPAALSTGSSSTQITLFNFLFVFISHSHLIHILYRWIFGNRKWATVCVCEEGWCGGRGRRRRIQRSHNM